ncbi:hypothetical protein QBC35DRAFT_454601 [Podospora australis]|uniref:FAD-binding domain-containing protein n=1 Tax=Podospora australis TaxID=1536484 RepID=A0AAN7AFW0_9PEZI|nr:hypothetical protein QBC35DRAFT_454601 [Podospora australis]
MAPPDADLPTIAIIGAGITGLLLAQGLQKNGYKVTVYEKENYLGEKVREWTMLLHWAWPVITKLIPPNLLEEVNAAYTDPSYPYDDKEIESIPFYNGLTGQLILNVPSAARRISRTRFRRLCSQGVDIHWGASITAINIPEPNDKDPVMITFANGKTAQADLVIGADGPNSFVRRFLVGEDKAKPAPTTIAIGNGLVKYTTAEMALKVRAPSPICALGTLPGMAVFSAVQEVPDPNDPATWTFHTALIWNEPSSPIVFLDGPKASKKVQEKIASISLAEPFRSAFHEIDPAHCNFIVSRLHSWETIPWSGGKVTLAGDAAHALLPARGQGLNQALADVDSFVTQFIRVKEGQITVREALGKYEEELFERGPSAVSNSLEDSKELMTPVGFERGRVASNGFRQVKN